MAKKVDAQGLPKADGSVSEKCDELVRAFERYVVTKQPCDWTNLIALSREGERLGLRVEPSHELLIQAAKWMPPIRLLSLTMILNETASNVIFQTWKDFLAVLRKCEPVRNPSFDFALRIFYADRAVGLAQCLSKQFAESSNPARYRGDAYLTINSEFYFNYHELCGECGLSKAEAIDALYDFADSITPDDEAYEQFGGKEACEMILKRVMPSIEGRDAPAMLIDFCEKFLRADSLDLYINVPKRNVRALMLEIVANAYGFIQPTYEFQILYEICVILKGMEGVPLDVIQEFVCVFFADTHGLLQPDEAWLKAFNELFSKLDMDRVNAILAEGIDLYFSYSNLTGRPTTRLTAVWMATHFDRPEIVHGLRLATTCRGSDSPTHPLSLIHKGISPEMLRKVVQEWNDYDQQSNVHWTASERALIMRYYVLRQCAYARERLVDLFLRGGGYDEGKTVESVTETLNTLFEKIALSPAEKNKFAKLPILANRLPKNINVFTGEEIDLSEWASSSSAYKYVKMLLKLSNEVKKIASPSYLPEKRAIQLENFLMRRDVSTSRDQIMAVCNAFEDPADACEFLVLLRESGMDAPSEAWVERVRTLMAKLPQKVGADMLWTLNELDSGVDETSLNPGIMWAFRFVASDSDVMALARSASDVGAHGVCTVSALLDTLNAIGTRTALFSILLLQRRVRSAKLHKDVQRVLDDIAKRDGFERNIFLDYAVDTCDLDEKHEAAFSFGDHKVIVSLTDQCVVLLTIIDRYGHILRNIPKCTRECYPELYAQFQATKRSVTETVEAQKKRLAKAFKEGRMWKGCDFINIFDRHPVMQQVGSSLVWQKVKDTLDACVETFTRLEGVWCDCDSVPVTIEPEAFYKLAVPSELTSELSAKWKAFLTDHRVNQVFKQFKLDFASFAPLTDPDAPPVKRGRKKAKPV